MAESRFVYVTFIRTTTAKLWKAASSIPSSPDNTWVETWQGVRMEARIILADQHP